MDANLGQPRASDWAHSPHQLDRQVMKKIQLSLGIDNHQSVRLGHLRGNFREVFGACHYHDLDAWRRYMSVAGFAELSHYYRPAGVPRERQPWLASVWRRLA